MMQMTETVKQLLIINIILFIGCMFVPAANEYLAVWYFENPLFKFWQPITYMFMHASLGHIFFNMFALYAFGSTLEYMWGPKKFLFFYISCGLGSLLFHMGINYFQFHDALDILVSAGFNQTEIYNSLASEQADSRWLQVLGQEDYISFIRAYWTPMVGASGAIYGLLAAFAFLFPNAELALMFIPIPIKAKIFVPILILIDLFSGVTGRSIMGDNIAHFAHVGGALVGILIVLYWKKNQFNQNRWDR
ncbi:rhomboid family intramembrane serine protease [Flavobacterium agricola]|uniref:Rhomboid family intramembrane serine protease n=1 Tax=Flavobacterium agricola TaxID=2870839 RepID=A0ABY6LZP5_9FLAO|nr:rhomboid family intramembrane serine protease [Flavobacterium agricola]UYW00336.1 rhomboid family intramembrane serine protease [Flavobacterium agricola]